MLIGHYALDEEMPEYKSFTYSGPVGMSKQRNVSKSVKCTATGVSQSSASTLWDFWWVYRSTALWSSFSVPDS